MENKQLKKINNDIKIVKLPKKHSEDTTES